VEKNGTLSVVKVGKSCPKHTTKLPLDEKGPKGSTGSSGAQGAPGSTGAAGTPGNAGAPGTNGVGATSYYATVAANGIFAGVTLTNGVLISGGCPASGSGNNVDLELKAEPNAHNIGGADLQASGTQAEDSALTAIDEDDPGTTGQLITGTTSVDFDVLARSSETATNTFYRVDFHADWVSASSSCHFWGVTVPAS
jgi:hypothetical protein